jgi:monovalent cation/hydrogen antiporter
VSSAHLLIVVAVAAVTLLAVAGLGRVGIESTVVFVVAGLIVGFLPFVPDVSLDPEVVLLGLLPLLVFDAALTASPTAFSRSAASIGRLATGLVVVTAIVVAAVGHWVGHLSWAMAFVLGTAVGPTDAAAATGIARRLGLPRRLQTILEGEALFNDATALVLYAAAVSAATGVHVTAWHTAGSIVYASAVGAGLGLIVGAVGRRLRSWVDDPPIEIAGSILLAYAAYLPAEALHASGVLAAVTAGLYLGWHSSTGAFSARTRLQSAAFWQTLVFLINAALFVLVGLSFHSFSVAARGPLGRLALTAAVVIVAVVGTRLAWMEASGWVARKRRRRGPVDAAIGWRERAILGWAGMRGAITLAALLAVPRTTHAGHGLAGRDDIIYLGFAVILATVIGQGLTLPPLVARLAPPEHPAFADAERRARLALTEAVLDRLDVADEDHSASPEVIDALRAQFLTRRRRLEPPVDGESAGDGPPPHARSDRALRRELLDLQRRRLGELRRAGQIGVTTQRLLEHELDLEEARLS